MVHPKFRGILHHFLNDAEGAVRNRYLQRRVRELETQYRQLQQQVNAFIERERSDLKRHRSVLCAEVDRLKGQLADRDAQIVGLQQGMTAVTHQRDHVLVEFQGSEDARAQEQALYEEYRQHLAHHYNDLGERINGMRQALQNGPMSNALAEEPGEPQGHVAIAEPAEEEEEEEEEPNEEPEEEEEPMEGEEQEEEPEEPAGPESEDEGQVDD